MPMLSISEARWSLQKEYQDLNITILKAKFRPHENCRGEGVITEIGFNANGNGSLDSDEVAGSTGYCKPPASEYQVSP